MPRPQRITLEMISKELNISTSSVSRALRNDPLIHPETRARVNSTATRLGYQGRSRRGPQKGPRQRNIRAVFAANSLTDIKSYGNMMAYIQGMTAEAEAAGILLSVHAVPSQTANTGGKDFSRALDMVRGDALIVSGTHDQAFVAKLLKSYPVVSLVRTYGDQNHDFVSTDNMSGIIQMVEKLAAMGHEKLAWISNEDEVYYSHARRAGFLEGCVSSGLDLAKQEIIRSAYENGQLKRPERLLQVLKKGCTAIVASSDHVAYEAWKVLSENGIKVPGDISLTGFDGMGEPGHDCPTFTSYDPRFVEIGRAAIRLVLWRLENSSASPLQITVGGSLIEGETIGPVKGSKPAVKKDLRLRPA